MTTLDTPASTFLSWKIHDVVAGAAVASVFVAELVVLGFGAGTIKSLADLMRIDCYWMRRAMTRFGGGDGGGGDDVGMKMTLMLNWEKKWMKIMMTTKIPQRPQLLPLQLRKSD